MNSLLFAFCLFSACSNSLLHSRRLSRRLSRRHHPSVHSQRHRRALRAASTHLVKTLGNPLVTAPPRFCALHPRSATFLGRPIHHQSLAPSLALALREAPIAMDALPPQPPQPPQDSNTPSASARTRHKSRGSAPGVLPPPAPVPLPPSDHPLPSSPAPSCDGRSSRSLSTTSRNSNRLSLTLPIAPPSNAPSRPTPISTTTTSFPPTPSDTPVLRSPADANDFIHAIAAHERRVLELRDDLRTAEAELARLKKQWGAFDSVRKRNAIVNGEPLRPLKSPHHSSTPPDVEATRRTIELDRRRTVIMTQQLNKEATSGSGRRRVLRGGHTRALSLLCPAKTQEFPALGSHDAPGAPTPPVKNSEPDLPSLARPPPLTVFQLNKRTSWTPRSLSPRSTRGVKQTVEEFKAGLWTFMDDLRQAAVGDEPINGGASQRRSPIRTTNDDDRDIDTIRAPSSNPRAPLTGNTFGDLSPTPASRSSEPLRSPETAGLGRPKPACTTKPTKHFSWTPLSVDAYSDSDWSNWDSPLQLSSPHWSGTSVGGGVDTIAPTPDKSNDKSHAPVKNETRQPPPRHREPALATSASALKLEELSLSVINKLKSLGEPVTPVKNKVC